MEQQIELAGVVRLVAPTGFRIVGRNINKFL